MFAVQVQPCFLSLKINPGQDRIFVGMPISPHPLRHLYPNACDKLIRVCTVQTQQLEHFQTQQFLDHTCWHVAPINKNQESVW